MIKLIIFHMGKINILKAGYSGKTGQTYGVEKKDRFIVKAVPFSHTPHNHLQNQAKDKFIGLNRIASAVVKKFWYYLGLSDKSMYRNNALTRAWKQALEGDVFLLENLKKVIPNVGALQIIENSFNYETSDYSYTITDNEPLPEDQEQYIYASVVTNRFITKQDVSAKGQITTLKSSLGIVDFAFIQVYAFKARRYKNKWYLSGLSITEKKYIIVVNGVFYMSRWQWNSKPFIKNGILYLSSQDTSIKNAVWHLYK